MMKGRVVWTRVPLSSSDFRTSHFLFPTNSQCSSFYCRTLAGGAGGLNRPVLAWPVPVALASSHIHV